MCYINSNTLKQKDIPILYNKKEECCGCSACYVVCPTGAIIMNEDHEGFLYPVVDEDKCVLCKKCISICAFKVDLSNI